jgi:DNA topoisomerase-1
MVKKITPILSHRDFLKIDKDYEATASIANLSYVSDKDEGITRIHKGSGFSFRYKDKTITDERQLARIKKLVIPPAWTNVWICPSQDGHIQATGFDVKGRKQYRYHARWSAVQQETKFHRMIEFGKVLPVLRQQLEKDLSLPGFPENKVIAMVLSLMERTYIRVGNEGYEKLYGSFGLTTLRNNHVTIKGNQITFAFKGKKGVYHKVTLKSKKFARIIRQCKAIPGKELFQYYNEDGESKKIDSGQVNQYIKNCLEMDFTTKDFRTWAGTVGMVEALKSLPPCEAATQVVKNISQCFQMVSQKLGNTIAVCKKYYVHPVVVDLYKENGLSDFINANKSDHEKKYGLTHDEEILMRILQTIEKSKVKISD